jgi:hypothetical protein
MLIINKRNVWNIEEKVTLIQEIEFGENSTYVCQEFGLAHYTIQKFGKTDPKLRMKCFESPNKVMSKRCCLSGFSNTEVTLYQTAVLLS